MSEKRFFTTLANDEYTFIQKKGNPRSTYLKYREVVDLLNKLYEENEKLRQKVAFFEEQEDEFEQYTAQTIENMIADYRDDE